MAGVQQQYWQVFTLLFLYTPLNRAIGIFSLWGLGLLLVAVCTAVEWLFYLAIPMAVMGLLMLFLSFHRQIYWVAGNQQLKLLPGIHFQLPMYFVLVVATVAIFLMLFEFFATRGASLHPEVAISLSIIFNCVALSVAYFMPLFIPFLWGMAIIASSAIWQFALHEIKWVVAIAATCVILLSLNWKKSMSVSAQRKVPPLVVTEQKYWLTFFQRYFAVFSGYHWAPRSLSGSLLLGRADNPWRAALGWSLLVLVLLFAALFIKHSAPVLQQQLLDYGILVAVAVLMLGRCQQMAAQIYANLARLWLVFPGERKSLLVYLEVHFLRQWLVGFISIALVVLALVAILAPGPFTELAYWINRGLLLIGLALVQCLFFYVSLWIYWRAEADQKWQSTVISMLTLVVIFAVFFCVVKVNSNAWNFLVVMLIAQVSVAACIGILRVRLVGAWPSVSLIKRSR